MKPSFPFMPNTDGGIARQNHAVVPTIKQVEVNCQHTVQISLIKGIHFATLLEMEVCGGQLVVIYTAVRKVGWERVDVGHIFKRNPVVDIAFAEYADCVVSLAVSRLCVQYGTKVQIENDEVE